MNFFTIEYEKICRDCLSTDGLNNIFSILGDEIPFIEKTEWQLSEYLLKESVKNEVVCENCRSSNFQIYDTTVNLSGNTHHSYDFERECYNLDNPIFYMICQKSKQTYGLKHS
jgi:hypothetical protein